MGSEKVRTSDDKPDEQAGCGRKTGKKDEQETGVPALEKKIPPKPPKYRQLKAEIMHLLESGQWKAHDRLPSENEFAARFGMSRQTVRQTLGELEQEGWLYRRQGKGTFVAPRKPPLAPDRRMVGMLTTFISDYIFPHIVRGAESELRARGYALLLASTENRKSAERDNLMKLLEQPLAGLIVEPTKSAEGNPNVDLYLSIQAKRIPMIMIHARYPELACPVIRTDDELGGLMAAEHLIGLGHRRIAGFFKTDDLQGTGRLKGFLAAHHRYGLAPSPELVVTYSTEEKRDKPVRRLLGMLAGGEPPTAVVSYNDELAVGLLDAIRTAGLSVPDDLSLVSFDDSPLATATEVKLTGIVHPKADMGRRAAELLVSMIESGQPALPGDDVVFPPELVVRGSTKKV